MEDKINLRRSERDQSPSAYSQSSTGLEWDPSADVGTSANIQDNASTRMTRSLSELSSATKNEIKYHKKSKSDSEGSSAGVSSTKAGDSILGTGMTRSEIEYQKKRGKDKSDSEGSSAGISTIKHGDSILGTGVTRSEIEYEKKKSKDKSDSEGSSVIWVEVQQTMEPRNKVLKSIGIQANVIPEYSEELLESATAYHVYHSTPTDRFRSRMQHKDKAVRTGEDEVEVLEIQDIRKRRERSPPQPFAVASRKSSHRCHNAHHSRVDEQQLGSHSQLSESDSYVNSSGGSAVVDNLVNIGQSKVKHQNELTLTAIEMQRDYHVKKVRHELIQLEKLNQLLDKNLKKRRDQSSNSSNKEDLRNREKRSENGGVRKKPSPPKYKGSTRSKPVDAKPNPSTSDHTSTNTTSTSAKDSSSRETYTISEASSSNKRDNGSIPLQESKQKRLQSSPNPLEKKLDKILEKFSDFANVICENKENVPARSAPKTKKGRKSKTEKTPVKSPVSYFINFGAPNGDFIIEDDERALRQQKDKNESDNVETTNRKSKNPTKLTAQKERKAGDVTGSDSNEKPVNHKDPHASGTNPQQSKRLSLQDAYQLRRDPSFHVRVQAREEILANIKTERKLRGEQKREWALKFSENPKTNFINLAPKGPRLMTTKQMRELTAKRYQTLPEVQAKILQRKAEEQKKINRLMKNVFDQNLCERLHQGRTDVLHTVSLIRHPDA